MTIINYKNKLIKVESKYLTQLIDNLGDYESLEVTAKLGCNGTPVTKTILTEDITTNKWVVDLTAAVSLNNTVYELYIQHLFTLREFNCIVTPIDLSYVETNCTTNSCTLETFQAELAPLFKTEIDNYFTANSVASNVTVTFSGNILEVTNMPTDFGLTKINYNLENETPYLESLFSFGGIDSNLILTEDVLYIKPSMFVAGATLLTDGVYEITIKLKEVNDGGYISVTTCAFIDVTTRCIIATQLTALYNIGEFSKAKELFLLHYGLVSGSNCGCNCPDLCAAYDKVLEIIDELELDPTVPSNPDDCGC